MSALGNCEKHGTPYRYEEDRDYPGKTFAVCDACRATGPLAELLGKLPPGTLRPHARPVIETDRVDAALVDVRSALERRLLKHGRGTYASRHEILGVLIEEVDELRDAVRTSDVDQSGFRAELVDIAVGAVFAIASLDAWQALGRRRGV